MSTFIRHFDRFCTKLWPSTQGGLDRRIYVDLVGYLYACRRSIISGAVGVTFIMLFLASQAEQILLVAYVLLIYVPVSIGRTRHVNHFQSLPEIGRHAMMETHEARYVFATMLNCISIAIMTSFIMFGHDTETKLAITCVIVGITTGIAGRNAAIPKLVRLQTTTLMLPVIIGLIACFEPLPLVIALLSLMFFTSMQDIATRINKDTIAAREKAFIATELALYDSLTGLPNRLYFDGALDKAFVSGHDFSVLYLDLDQFKNVNDTKGHPAGDQLLCKVAERLKDMTDSEKTLIARFGGDEFVIMTMDDPVELACDIIMTLNEPVDIDVATITIGCSVGISRLEDAKNSVDLLKHADVAMYMAKQNGRNRYMIFDNAMEKLLLDKSALEERLRIALLNDTIILNYQPIIDMTTGKIYAAEALARWHDADLGHIAPDKFIALAENIGVIDILGEKLLKLACCEAVYWTSGIPVAVNVSAMQFKNSSGLINAIKTALKVSGLPANRLEIEITEGTMMEDTDIVYDTILAIKKLGVKIALDDFGSGYCSLSYLDRIPFDKIKIDRSLVTSAAKSRAQEIVVRMVCQIANELSAQVVVEGIETEAQAAHMRLLGATLAQGYFYGRPSADHSRFMVATEDTKLRALN